mmetsp:Transcript_101089/g.292346  ORF Transcript_101089/g.292346 Transcript_101089/m.292346 type:complete len:421 (+) Transcript_101089:58-1320(+)
MGCAGSTTAVDEGACLRKHRYETKVFDVSVERPRPAHSSKPSSPGPAPSFHEKHALIGRLGQGAFASVHLAKSADGELLAVKITDLRSKGSTGWSASQLDMKKWENASKEIGVLQKASGLEHVVKFRGSYMEGGLSYILLERCDTNFYQALVRKQPALTEATISKVFSQMLKGIVAVHSAGVVHRDIKPDNFMATGPDGAIKLCDFGLAACVDPSVNVNAPGIKGVFGTPPYMAPEMLNGHSYGAKVDVWSFGVIVYLLFFGKFPYTPAKASGSAMKAAIVAGLPAPTFTPEGRSQRGPGLVCHHAMWFSRLLLERHAGHRMKAKDALRHAFFDVPASERGTASLRPMLHSAKRIGAFSPAADDRSPPSSLDTRLIHLQEERREKRPPSPIQAFEGKKRSRELPSDTSSTNVGSEGETVT